MFLLSGLLAGDTNLAHLDQACDLSHRDTILSAFGTV